MCARLTVPMDYHRPLDASPSHPKVDIALLMVPGKREGPPSSSSSPLLINPGGPGGSGTSFAEIAGSSLQAIVGSSRDVIGFDPRGIGATTPRIDCFSWPRNSSSQQSTSEPEGDDYVGGLYRRVAWMNSRRAIGLVNSSAVALPKYVCIWTLNYTPRLCYEVDVECHIR